MSDERSKFEFKIKKEYALIVAVIAAAIIFAIVVLYRALKTREKFPFS